MTDISPRLQAAIGFATAAIALAFVTLFVMVDMLKPALEQGTGEDLAPIVAALYPFPAVTEVRIAYCIIALLPILLPLCFGGRIAAITTLAAGALVTLINVQDAIGRSEEHTSELQSLMRISYAVFCLKTTIQIRKT